MYGTRFGQCKHSLKELFSKEKVDVLCQSLITDIPCAGCNMTVENYIEKICTTNSWPADSWLCNCGTMIHRLSPTCPCNHPPRKISFPQFAVFMLRNIYQKEDFPKVDICKGNLRPFSLPILLATIFHPDHVNIVNKWLDAVNQDPSLPKLDGKHLKALTPNITWECYQLDSSNCQCPNIRLVDNTANVCEVPEALIPPPLSLPQGNDYPDSDLIEFHADSDLLDLGNQDWTETMTASSTPPPLRSRTTANQLKAPSNVNSEIPPPSVLVQTVQSSQFKGVSIKDRLGPKKQSNPSISSQINDPGAIPCFFKGLYSPDLSPQNIRLTQILPAEITGPNASARFIQEMYCLELVQYYSTNCPTHLRNNPPHLVPKIFLSMRSEQLAARKSWLMKNFLRKNQMRSQLFVHADRALSDIELGTPRIPLQVILNSSAPLIPSNLKFFEQISELQRLQFLEKSTGKKRKAQGQLSCPPSKKPTPLMDIIISPHIKSQTFTPSPSAGCSRSRPPPKHPSLQAAPAPKPILPHSVETTTTKAETFTAPAEPDKWYSGPTGSGFTPAPPQVKTKTAMLNPEQLSRTVNACSGENPYKIVSKMDTLSIRLADLRRLMEGGLMNDRILNFYLRMIQDRSQNSKKRIISLNTNFYPKLLQRGFNGVHGGPLDVDIIKHIFHPSTHTVLIPIHLYEEQHWTLIVLNVMDRTCWHYDSLPGNRHHVVKHVLKYMKEAFTFCFGSPLSLDNKLPDIPTQTNGTDCGVFLMQYAEEISRNSAHTFKQEEVPEIRKRIIFEILSKKIIPH